MTAPDCPRPDRCRVPDPTSIDTAALQPVELAAGIDLRRVYETAHDPAGYNDSGRSTTRFAPIDGAAHVYVARRRTVALLETVFHDVHAARPRIIYTASDLQRRGLATVRLVRSVRLVSLRDDALETLGLHRRQLVATSAAHYRCTRHWAATLGGQAVDGMLADGLVWNSRVAELARADSPLLDDLLIDDASLSAVLWRRPGAATAVTLQGEVVDDLTAGPGRALVDAVAEQLDAEIH